MKRSIKIYLIIWLMLLISLLVRYFAVDEYNSTLGKLNKDFFINILQILAVLIGFIGTWIWILLQEKQNSVIKSIAAAWLKTDLIWIYKTPLFLSFFWMLFSLFMIIFDWWINLPLINTWITINDLKSLFIINFMAILIFYFRWITLLFEIIKS